MFFNKKLKNIVLNEQEIAKGKIVLKSYPRQAHVLLNSKCNLRCEMCGICMDKYSLSDRQFRDLIWLMPYLQLLIIQGGEVFLDDRINEILKHAVKNRVKIDLLTNGLLLNKKISKNLVKTGVNLVFSIDSPYKETYESIRCGAKFKKLINNIISLNKIRKFKKNNMKTAINMLVMKKNYKHIKAMIEFAKQYEFNTLILSSIAGSLPDDRKENFLSIQINEKIRKKIAANMTSYKKKAEKNGITLFNHIPLISVKKTDKDQYPKEQSFCKMPFLRITMDDKFYSPDCRCHNKMKIKKQKSIFSMWNSRIMQKYRRDVFYFNENNGCKTCFSNLNSDV